MKNLLKTLSIFGLSLTLGVIHAQSSSNVAKSQIDPQSIPSQDNAKSAYIANQDYLSLNSTALYKNVYGDSLKGFDEKGIKTYLLSQGASGLEVQNHIFYLKRQYINNKYGIGQRPNYLPETRYGLPNSNGGNSKYGNNTVNVAPCVNEGFESTTPGAYTSSNAVTGWTITSRQADGSCNPTNWTPGSTAFEIVTTPILNWGGLFNTMGVIPNSPLGGNNVAQLNNFAASDYNSTRMAQTFPVTSANTTFQFAYAGYWQDGGGGHSCCPSAGSQAGLSVKMYDCTGSLLTCSNLSLSPGSGCASTGVTFSLTSQGHNWTNWQVKYIDLTPYIGTCVTIEFITTDCSLGGHWGATLIDAQCGGQLIGVGLGGSGGNVGGPVSYCAGSNVAQITAPVGYSTYQWFAPGTGSIAAPQGTMSTLTVSNPIPGSVYTVQLVAPSGCIFTSTNAILSSTVTIAGVGSSSTCAGGASGSATVVGNGSGTGYNYTWINAANSAVVGTTQIVNNLSPGIYSVVLSGLGAAGCGSAVATVTVNTAPPGIIQLLKPFCNNEAYLSGNGGSGHQWYNNNTPIPAPFGTNPTYTVSNPVNGSIYWLSYLSAQGCQDSIKYTLVSSSAGLISVSNTSICPGGSNGTTVVNLSPAPGAPPGANSFSVWAIGTTAPYTASLFPTAQNAFTVNGLSAGTYTASVFDGSCKYGATFNVNPHIFNYSLTLPTSPSSGLPSATLCSGSSTPVAVSFTTPVTLNQYTYTWTPSNFLVGTSAQNSIVNPVLPVGTTSVILYSVKVTPTIINCPITKQFEITVVNPPIPTITAIPNLCNNSAPYQIITNPAGGTFNTGITGTNNPISSSGGILSPTLANIGVNTFTYSISVLNCGASNTASYHVSQFWSSALTTPTVAPMCVTSPLFNLMNIVQNTSNGSWSGVVPGSVIGGTQFNPAGLSTGVYQVSYNTVSTPIATVCPSSTTLNISVTNTSTPFIEPVPEFCTNAAPITMTVNPPNGGWLPNPNNALSNSGVLTPGSVPVPGMVATYTVADGPCVNSNTTAILASTFNPATLTGTVNHLCYDSAPFNLMSIVQNSLAGSWRDTTGVLTNSFFPGGLPTGIYVATYSTVSSPNPNLCSDSQTIAISVLNPQTPSITAIGPLCNNGAPIQLTVTPNTGQWTTSPYLSSNGVLTPSLTSVGINAIQYVVGTNTCNVQETKFVSIEAFVPATITGAIPDLCNTSPALNLLPFTLSSQGIWSGTGIVGASFDPSVGGSGSFVLTHNTASSPSGLCPDQASISVNVYSLGIPALAQEGPLCNNALPVQLKVNPVGGMFGGPNVGIVNSQGLFNPAAAIIGDNVINYSITAGPCIAYAQTIIKVEKFISADFAQIPGPFCKTSEPVNMNSYVQNPGGEWSGDAILGTMFNPFVTIANKSKVSYRTFSSPTKSLCPDVKEVEIEVRETPTVTVTRSVNGECVPVEVLFTVDKNVGVGSWSMDDGSEPISGLEATHIFTTPGVYNAQFNYADEIGCKAEPIRSEKVEVFALPVADFSFPDEIFVTEPQVQLTNLTTSLSDNKYIWKMSGTSPKNDINPVYTFPKTGRYQITLVATSIKGCEDQITKTIEVKNVFNIFIPNSFSPNFDGLNDHFMPVFSKEGFDMKSFEMEIFDRWGHSLFYTKDATSKGWDGSVQNKGEPLKEEVYIYRIKYKDMEGNAYNKMGHVSLVK